MTSLLVLKEKVVGFYKNFEYPVQMIGNSSWLFWHLIILIMTLDILRH